MLALLLLGRLVRRRGAPTALLPGGALFAPSERRVVVLVVLVAIVLLILILVVLLLFLIVIIHLWSRFSSIPPHGEWDDIVTDGGSHVVVVVHDHLHHGLFVSVLRVLPHHALEINVVWDRAILLQVLEEYSEERIARLLLSGLALLLGLFRPATLHFCLDDLHSDVLASLPCDLGRDNLGGADLTSVWRLLLCVVLLGQDG